jgi:hypothetical protein
MRNDKQVPTVPTRHPKSHHDGFLDSHRILICFDHKNLPTEPNNCKPQPKYQFSKMKLAILVATGYTSVVIDATTLSTMRVGPRTLAHPGHGFEFGRPVDFRDAKSA